MAENVSGDHVLVTGGAGFIGSHTCKQLSERGYVPVVFDNLSRGRRENVKWGPLWVGDILDIQALEDAIEKYRPVACIHFAALAYVHESTISPDLYYENNVIGTIRVMSTLKKKGILKIVFSSSCATYGIPNHLPIMETEQQHPINPYGRTKLICEQIISDWRAAYGFRYICLRYFNAAGADPEGILFEDHDPETHLIPRCLMVAAGQIPYVEVFGDDYPTEDGTCIRDYVHVNDLASGHCDALSLILHDDVGFSANLGTGQGTSIAKIIKIIEEITGRPVQHQIKARRAGDPPVLVADVTHAARRLRFSATNSSIENIIKTAWIKYA